MTTATIQPPTATDLKSLLQDLDAQKDNLWSALKHRIYTTIIEICGEWSLFSDNHDLPPILDNEISQNFPQVFQPDGMDDKDMHSILESALNQLPNITNSVPAHPSLSKICSSSWMKAHRDTVKAELFSCLDCGQERNLCRACVSTCHLGHTVVMNDPVIMEIACTCSQLTKCLCKMSLTGL
jgi:hypothetical protein